jgi:polyphosphate kinase 2 (PPK2 family)
MARVYNLVPQKVWSKRYEQINDFERRLVENGTHILKFFVYISKEEQLGKDG